MENDLTHKICSNCNIEKPVDEFYQSLNLGKIRVHYNCKSCWRKKYSDKSKVKYSNLPKIEDLDGEMWKDINEYGFEGRYQISNLGRVKSFPKKVRPYESVIKPTFNPKRQRHTIILSSKGIEKGFLLYRLIAIAFIPNPFNKPCINHINNDPSDYSISNLEWCTYQENTDHAMKCGRFEVGEERYNCKLTNFDVAAIFNSNKTNIELSKIYNISKSSIQSIKVGRTWSHITGKIYDIEKRRKNNKRNKSST